MHDIIVTRLIESERVLQQNRQAETSGFGTMLKSLANRFSRPHPVKPSVRVGSRPKTPHSTRIEGEPAR